MLDQIEKRIPRLLVISQTSCRGIHHHDRSDHHEEDSIPVDLVTCSGSGLDPDISPAAAEYQVPRLAKANNMSEDEIRDIIEKCTDGRFLGVMGEKTVNVLKVNLMLEGILK